MAAAMKLKDWLVPREEKFFEILEEQSKIVTEGAEALVVMLQKYDDAVRNGADGPSGPLSVRAHKRRIKEIEHRGDLKTHELYTALNATFITPLDREDISGLASALDDILDYTYDTAKHLFLYEVKAPPKELLEVAMILRDQTLLLQECFEVLSDPAKREHLKTRLVEIHSLENQADELTDRMKTDLFRGDDVKHILKMKDILEYIETATDKCEDAADVIRDILVKHQ
jgi:predicted phosphate transport protein (TIGR00153 family)